MQYDTSGERELVTAAALGDRDAFRLLFERYRRPVFRIAYRFTGNTDDAEDLAQDVFVRLYQRLSSFRGESAFSSWLYRLAVNVCLNARRARHDACLDDLGWDPADPRTGPEETVIGREWLGRVRRAVEAMPDSLREVFALAGEDGLSYVETAEALGLTVEAVRTRMCRARRVLRARLEADRREEEA